MADFSIRKSLQYAAKTYVNHFILFLSIGVVLGVASWATIVAPRLLAQKTGVYKHIVVPYRSPSPNQQFRSNTIGIKGDLKNFAYGAGMVLATKVIKYIQATSKTSLLFVFLLWIFLWLFSAFLHLGLVQVALDIKDMKTSSLDRLFSVWNFFPSFLYASLLFGALALASIIGFIVIGFAIGAIVSALLGVLIKTSFPASAVVAIFSLFSFVALILFLLRYIFYGYCLLDKETTALGALSCSREVTYGSIQKLTLFFVLLHTLIYGLYTVVSFITGYSLDQSKADLSLISLVHMITVATIGGPLFVLALVYVYRQLSS